FRAFPEYVDALVCTTGVHENRAVVVHRRDPALADKVVECVCRTVREWCAREPIPLAQVRLVVAPARSFGAGLERRVADALGIELHRLVSLEAVEDYFTSSLARAFQRLRQEPGPALPVLFIEVAAGLQVWCALYSPSKS